MFESKENSILQEDLKIIAKSNLPLEKFKNSRIFITGSTGLIGSQLTRAFAYCNRIHKLNMKILLFIKEMDRAKEIYGDLLSREDIEYIIGDIRDDLFIEKIDKKIDYIIHAAAITTSKTMIERPVDVIDISIKGTKNMLEIAKANKIKGFIYISSMEMYGNLSDSSKYISEDNIGKIDILNVRSNYPESKRMCENMCVAYMKQYNVPIYIARLAQTFGAGILPWENRVFAQFAKSVINGENIVLHTKGLSEGNYCYTRDMVLAIMTILLKGKEGEAYNVVNEKTHTTIAEMANMVANEVARGKIKVIYDIPDNNIFGYANDVKMKLSSKKLCALGWQPTVGLKEAYNRMIKDMK